MSDLVRGIHHINIHCTDKNQLERTVLFYKEQFDFEPIRHWKNGQREVYLLSTGNTALEIAAQSTEPEEKSKGTVIDIGGQDSKAIKVNTYDGKVVDFVMNDKCAAGTGRFLEKVAQILELKLDELGPVAVKSEKPCDISSQCVVFAESEIISLRATGAKKEDIAYGVHLATARRVRNLLRRTGFEPDILFTGGVNNNIGMIKALEQILGEKIVRVKLDTMYAGALSAALTAASK